MKNRCPKQVVLNTNTRPKASFHIAIAAYCLPIVLAFAAYSIIIMKTRLLTSTQKGSKNTTRIEIASFNSEKTSWIQSLFISYGRTVINKVSLVLLVWIVTVGPYILLNVLQQFHSPAYIEFAHNWPQSSFTLFHGINVLVQMNHIFDPLMYAYSSQKFQKALKGYLQYALQKNYR